MSTPSHTQLVQQESKISVALSFLAWSFIVLLVVFSVGMLKPPKPVPATAALTTFSAERAFAYVQAIARTPHPIGSSANVIVRDYLVSQLSALGLNPQIFTAVGISRRNRGSAIANVQDIVGRLPGNANSRAIALMAHYDSVYRAPGAGDDAAGVAAILETVRALRAGPALRNDVVVVFTDGEEAGLLGAEAFASLHPWVKDVGLILNFEGRGDQGPSLLFETSAGNAALIDAVAQSTPDPIGSSLFYALYKLLPNDTDFTVFRPLKMPGLNFAFGAGLEAYHSPLDTAESLDLRSLQHHGDYALSLTRHFAQQDIAKLKQPGPDDIFFDWLGSNLIVYRESWVIPGEIVATILLALAIGLAARNSGLKIRRVLFAIPFCLLLLLSAPLVMAVASWLLASIAGRPLIVSDSLANSCLLAGFTLLGVCAGSFCIVLFRKRFSILELSLAGLMNICILSWVIALVLPGGSYLLFWPLLFVTVSFLILALSGRNLPSKSVWLAGVPGVIISVLLFAPLGYLLYIFLTLQLVLIIAIGLLVGLFFLISIPFIDTAVPYRKWQPATLAVLLGALISLGAGIKLSHYSNEHPLHDTLLYSVNADDHTALWITYDRSIDSWTAQLLSNKQLQREPQPNYLGGTQRRVLSAPAPVQDLAPPVAEIKSHEKSGDTHKIKMTIRTQRNARALYLTFSKDVDLVSVMVAGREAAPMQSSGPVVLTLYGVDDKGIDLDLTLETSSNIAFWLTDQSAGLPKEAHPRPPGFMPEEGSDVTLVCRKYSL